MGVEQIILGFAGMLIGISIYAKTSAIIPALIPGILGLALVIFYKKEDEIEKREDER